MESWIPKKELLKIKTFLLALMVPWRTFNINATFPVDKMFFRLWNVLHTTSWVLRVKHYFVKVYTFFFHFLQINSKEMLSFMTLVISLNLGFQNNLNEIAYFSQTTNSAIKSQISKALFTLLATWSHSFLMRAGDIQWHKWQRQDKVEKSLTLCKWELTLGTDYQWKWVNTLYLLSDIAVECQCDRWLILSGNITIQVFI